MPDLRVVSARPVSISRNGKIKARKRKPNSLGTLSTVTGFVYPGGNAKLMKDATTDPYAKKRRKKKAKARNSRKFSGSSKQGVMSKRRKLAKMKRKGKSAQAKYLAAKHGDTGVWGKLNPRKRKRKTVRNRKPLKRKSVRARKKSTAKRSRR
jgi:hypothetical protein